jgi:hypothetical protein
MGSRSQPTARSQHAKQLAAHIIRNMPVARLNSVLKKLPKQIWREPM